MKSIIHYPNLPSNPLDPGTAAAVMQSARRAGVDTVAINHLPDLMHPELLSQPENVYLWFANFGPPLDLFVSSRLNRGMYPESYLERNRRCLLLWADAARSAGLRPMLYLCEPRFVPERFFLKHPTLRGPRVDNPTCSTKPLYALCTDRPEVQEHYREMLREVMRLIPDLAMITLFTSDSGAGFDYNPDTYAGANGAGFNRGIPIEVRASNFLRLLVEVGRETNPGFEVHLTSGFPPELRAKILERTPQEVVGSVYGLYDWEGGLEEHWAYHQSRFDIASLDRTSALEARRRDMRERFAVAAAGGKSPIVHAELPTTDYPRPLRHTPHPFETIRVARDLEARGAERVALWGVISPEVLVPQDVNLEAMRAAWASDAAPEDIVRGIAAQWVGDPLADALVSAWRDCDLGFRTRPLWTHCGFSKEMWPGPMVPDPLALDSSERAYYTTIALDDLTRIQGLGASFPHEANERNRDHVLDHVYNAHTLPLLQKSVAALEAVAAGAPEQARAILLRQRDHVLCALLHERSMRNWYEAGRYLTPGADPGSGRALVGIIKDEIEATHQWIALLEGREAQFLRLSHSDYASYEVGPCIVHQLRRRIEVMQAHINDTPRSLTDRLGRVHSLAVNLAEDLVLDNQPPTQPPFP